jgi:hypothetical protein
MHREESLAKPILVSSRASQKPQPVSPFKNARSGKLAPHSLGILGGLEVVGEMATISLTTSVPG